MRLALPLLALLAASPAGAVCAKVKTAGKPLPSGLASLLSDPRKGHPGTDERYLVRLAAGKACFKDVAPGDYRLEVSPLGLLESMPLDREAVSVSAGKPDETFEAAWLEPKPAADWARVETRLSGPGGRPADGLVAVWMPGHGYAFAWSKAGQAAVSVPAGRVGAVLADAGDLAISELDPPYAMRGHDSMSLKAAQTQRLTVTLARAERARVRVTAPDGRPFAPRAGAAAPRRSVFGFTLSNLYATQEFKAYADSDGVVEVLVPAGLWQWQPLWEGDGFAYSAGAADLRRHDAGRSERTYRLGGGATVRLTSAPEGGPWQAKYAEDAPIARRVLAAPSAPWSPALSLRFLLEDEMPVCFLHGRDGWRPSGNGAASAARAAPGRYDAWLVETRRWLDFPSARVLAHGTVTLAEGKEAELSFAKPGEAGASELRGSVKATMRWTMKDLSRASTLTDFHLLLAPLVNLYDESGTLVGMAIGNIANKDYNAFGRAAEKGDMAETARLLYGAPREFRIKGLPARRYRAEVVVFGYEPRRFDVDLTKGKVSRLDVDLDKT